MIKPVWIFSLRKIYFCLQSFDFVWFRDHTLDFLHRSRSIVAQLPKYRGSFVIPFTNAHSESAFVLVTWSWCLVRRSWGVRWSWGIRRSWGVRWSWSVGRSWSVGWSVRWRCRTGNGGNAGLASEKQVLGALDLWGWRWIPVGHRGGCVNRSWGVWRLRGVGWRRSVWRWWGGKHHVGGEAGSQEGDEGNGMHDEGGIGRVGVKRKKANNGLVLFQLNDIGIYRNNPIS